MCNNQHDQNYLLIKEQIPFIEQIIRDECWLEGERRKQPVNPNDPVIQNKLFAIILKIGADMRKRAEQQLISKNSKNRFDIYSSCTIVK